MARTIVLAFCTVLALAGLASAQTITASITGNASDPSGAIIPGAAVTATNVETNIRTTTTSNAESIWQCVGRRCDTGTDSFFHA